MNRNDIRYFIRHKFHVVNGIVVTKHKFFAHIEPGIYVKAIIFKWLENIAGPNVWIDTFEGCNLVGGIRTYRFAVVENRRSKMNAGSVVFDKVISKESCAGVYLQISESVLIIFAAHHVVGKLRTVNRSHKRKMFESIGTIF